MLSGCGRNFLGSFFGNVLISSEIHHFSFLAKQVVLGVLHQSIHKYFLEVFGKWIFALLRDQDGEGWNAEASITTSQGGLVKQGPGLLRVKWLRCAEAEGWIRVKVIFSESLRQKSPSCTSRRDSADLEPFWFPLQFISSCGFHLGSTQSTLYGVYRQYVVNSTQIFNHFLLIYHYQNVFAITFFYLSKSSGNSVVKISCLRIHSKISAWAVRAEGLLACWQSYSPEKGVACQLLTPQIRAHRCTSTYWLSCKALTTFRMLFQSWAEHNPWFAAHSLLFKVTSCVCTRTSL